MSELKVTSLDEIREQAKPAIITIPGFRPGATINVAIKPVDLTPYLLQVGIGNPMIASETASKAPDIQISVDKIAPVLDAIAKEALAEPTYDEILAIAPLTLDQKLTIFMYVANVEDLPGLESFRKERGI